MDLLSVMRAGFRDELTKIAGYSRIGRRPYSVATLLKKKSAITKLSTKVSVPHHGKKLPLKALALMGAGALGENYRRKTLDDWRNGREMRRQSQGYY